MILVRVEVERMNDTHIEHKIVHSESEIEDIKDELEMTKKRLYSSDGFVGYYSYYVSTEDIESIKIDELKGLTLKQVKQLLDYIE